jgi:hypothetical protein
MSLRIASAINGTTRRSRPEGPASLMSLKLEIPSGKIPRTHPVLRRESTKASGKRALRIFRLGKLTRSSLCPLCFKTVNAEDAKFLWGLCVNPGCTLWARRRASLRVRHFGNMRIKRLTCCNVDDRKFGIAAAIDIPERSKGLVN